MIRSGCRSKCQAAERIDLAEAVIAVFRDHDLDLLLRILDAEDVDAIRIQRGFAMIAADDLDLDGRVFFTGCKVKCQEVAVCFIAGERSGIAGYILQRAANAGSSDCHIALKICNVFTEQIFVSSNVGVNSQST